MRSEKLQDAIGMIDPDLVERAEWLKPSRKGRFSVKWIAPVAAVLVFAIVIGVLNGRRDPLPETAEPPTPVLSVLDACALAQATYPIMARYPSSNVWDEERQQQYQAWWEDQNKQKAYFGAGQGLEDFFSSTVSVFLADSNGENRVYSPLNLYMALAMLAEAAGGNSRAQILDVLGVDSMETLRTQANGVWNANYCDDGTQTTVLASSLWLENGLSVQREVVDRLANTYYASSYQGNLGGEEMNEALRMWVNQQTGNFLEEQIGDLSFSKDTVMAIATTLYFRADWSADFSKKATKESVFHAPTGDITVPFMNQKLRETYYWGEHFAAVSKSFSQGGSMWLILPDEDVSLNDLLTDEETLRFITAKKGDWENQRLMEVTLSMPKFDMSSNLELSGGLRRMGLADCFNPWKADFSSIVADDHDIFLDRVDHRVRVSVDEEGVEGASVTLLGASDSAQPPPEVDEIDFVLDRPFLFVITGGDGLPLFIGTVNQP